MSDWGSGLKREEWVVDTVHFFLRKHGPNEGKYGGTIKFVNADEEAIEFRIKHEESVQILEILADKIEQSAQELSMKMLGTVKAQIAKRESDV